MIDIIALATPLADFFDNHHGDGGAGWWVLMSIGMFAFWGVVIAGVVWLVRGGSLGAPRRSAPEDPLDVLDRRLAEGALSPEEYEERRRLLRSPPDGAHGTHA